VPLIPIRALLFAMAPRTSLPAFAALVGCSLGARIAKKSRHMVSTRHIGTVPVFAETEALDDKWLVNFKPGTTDAMIEEFCAGRCSLAGHPDSGGIPFAVLRGEGMMMHSVMAHQANVKSVDVDTELFDEEVDSDPEAVPWGLARVGVGSARGKGEGVNIYVLDSGVRVSHRDFGGRAIPTFDAGVRPPRACGGDANCAVDDRGHGTHCAGSAGGTTYGVAPLSTIMAMDRGGSYSDAFGSMDWLAMNHIKPAVVTMSFGSGGTNSGAEAAVDAVVAAGVTVTVAAGNNRGDACRFTFGFVPSAIAVGSSTSTDTRSSFSNYGECVALFAPGSSILSADYRSDTGTSVKSGTSMATPHVAGGIAVILGENPSLTPAKVKQRLEETAERDALGDARGSANLMLRVD